MKNIVVDSIYNGKPLPTRMAKCTPDMANAIDILSIVLVNKKSKLVLSDLFRSYDMQFQAHLDYTSGKKKAFSPAPGGSMHEAGRAMDIDISALSPLTLSDFWDIAQPLGFNPIIDTPDTHKSECWHFDFRGSFQKIYDYMITHQTGTKPYTMMAALAILEQGIEVDDLKDKKAAYLIQSCLVRLGLEIGNIDGLIGSKCIQAAKNLGYSANSQSLDDLYSFVNCLIKQRYPNEQ